VSCRGEAVPDATREGDVSIWDGIFARWPPMSEEAKVGISGGRGGRLQIEATNLQMFYALPSSRGHYVIYCA